MAIERSWSKHLNRQLLVRVVGRSGASLLSNGFTACSLVLAFGRVALAGWLGSAVACGDGAGDCNVATLAVSICPAVSAQGSSSNILFAHAAVVKFRRQRWRAKTKHTSA